MQMTLIEASKKNEKLAKRQKVKLIEEREKARFWKNVQKRPDGCWSWTGTEHKLYSYFNRSTFGNKATSDTFKVKTPPHVYAKKMIDGLLEKSINRKKNTLNCYFLKNGDRIIGWKQTCKTYNCCNPSHFVFKTTRATNEVRMSDDTEKEQIDELLTENSEKPDYSAQAALKKMPPHDFSVHIPHAEKALNINGVVYYHQDTVNELCEQLSEDKEESWHSAYSRRRAEQREEGYEALYESLKEALSNFEKACDSYNGDDKAKD